LVSSARRFSIDKARKAQATLSTMVIEEDRLPRRIKYVAGADVAFTQDRVVGAIAVLSYEELSIVEEKIAVLSERFPYVPTLLSFREAPAIIASFMKLKVKPDVIFIDGQGLAHPYRCGLATHIGVVLDVPTIGVAKSKLWGEVVDRDPYDVLVDPRDGKVIGAILVTKKGFKPIYISVGNKVSLETAIKLVLKTTKPETKLPEPILAAHRLATKVARRLKN